MDQRTEDLLLDAAVGLAAGLVATAVTNLAQDATYRATPERIRREEERVRPGPSAQVAARRIAEEAGTRLEDDEARRAGRTLHYAVGAGWGLIYAGLRRRGMGPVPAGLAAGLSLSLVVDEGIGPVLGFSAPHGSYPALTHLRGLLNHLVYGAAVAAAAEALGGAASALNGERRAAPSPGPGRARASRPASARR